MDHDQLLILHIVIAVALVLIGCVIGWLAARAYYREQLVTAIRRDISRMGGQDQ